MWLKDFFNAAFSAVGPLGLSGFGLLVILALVAIVVGFSDGSGALVGWFGTIALVSVVGIMILSQFFPNKPILIPAGSPPPAPAPSVPANSARWFDTGLQADWGGSDRFYGAGDTPVYKGNDLVLCSDDHLGLVATCWSSRPANSSSMAPGVPTNISQPRNDWCAYKDNGINLGTRPSGGAFGRVYACAHFIAP
jgi:hypothetical protein